MRVHRPVSPKSNFWPISMKPARAASRGVGGGMASSRVAGDHVDRLRPMSPTLARTFSRCAGTKMDHALDPDRQVARQLRGADGERLAIAGDFMGGLRHEATAMLHCAIGPK